MEKRMEISTWQKVSRDDFNNFGLFPQQSLDDIVGKILIPDYAYSGFPIVQSGVAEVTVGRGWLMALGKIFFNDTDGGYRVDLLTLRPAATRKIIAITVWGTEIDTKLEPRTFLEDAETRSTVARETATQHWRWANIGAVAGIEGPDPVAPAVQTDVLVVGYVTMTPAGIESVSMNTSNLVPTLRGLAGRMNEMDIWRAIIGTKLDTLTSDLINLAGRIAGLARYEFVRRVTADVARIKDVLRLPDAYTAWASDHFLTDAESDPTHVDWLARVEEGVRFPPAAQRDAQLGLLNPFDAGVINSSNVLLPKWSHMAWYMNLSYDQEVSLSQYQYQTTNMVQRHMSRTRLRYGTPFTVCTNTEFWQNGTFDYRTFTFRRADGEVFNVLAEVDLQDTPGWEWGSHKVFRLQQVWSDSVDEPYWESVTTDFAVNGAVAAQTLLVGQDGWLTRLRLYFSRIATTGDVTVLVCQTTNGAPDPKKIIARTTVLAADLRQATIGSDPVGDELKPVYVNFQPTYLQKGRYGFIIVTSGNHFLWATKNKNIISGTFFYSTDGEWFQGDLTLDINMVVEFAHFEQVQTIVQMQALLLDNGIAAIDINADAYVPPGAQLVYQVQKDGIWYNLDLTGGGPSAVFIGLPPLLPFRAVFVGTAFIQPALGVASNSRLLTWRPRSDFRHISAIRTMPAPVTTVTADIRLEGWDGAPHHTFIAKLLHGAGYLTVRNPDVTVEEVAQDDPSGLTIIRHYTWTGMGALSSFRFRFDGTTDNVLNTYHVAERLDIDT